MQKWAHLKSVPQKCTIKITIINRIDKYFWKLLEMELREFFGYLHYGLEHRGKMRMNAKTSITVYH